MKSEAKKDLVAASLYIVLAIMIVTVVCATVISVAKRAKDNMPTEDSGTTQGTEAPPTASTAPTSPAPSHTEQTNPPSTKPSEPQSTSAPAPSADEQVDTPLEDPLPSEFTLPCDGYVSKGYESELPVWSETMEDYRIHDGIDVVCESGADVLACAAGTIESVYEDPLMGYAITVYHGGGLRSTYLGLSGEYPHNIKEGTEVAAGQVIAYVGDTALIECAEPTHLHFIMTMDEDTVDPLNYIEYESAVLSDSVEFED